MRAVFLLTVCALPVAAEELSCGPWHLTYGSNGPGELRHHGKPVVLRAAGGFYEPGWKGSRLNLGGMASQVTRQGERATVTWKLTRDGVADVTIALTLSPEQAVWSLVMEAKQTGPVEFGLYLPAESVSKPTGELALDPTRTGRQVRFERPAVTTDWTLACSPGGWQVQDRRDKDGWARLIAVLPVNEPPTRIEASAALTVTTYPEAEAASRAKILDQRAQWQDEVAFPNAGFKDGLTGWNVAANAAVETDQPAEGKSCARLTVDDPLKDSVYITRQVPVVGGARYVARCRVRTAGVTARPGKMSSVGAGLIIEWADKDGKWFASGAYATGLFGDNGWTVKETTEVRAPDEAGFATIFLALRGAGTAWFDDVSLTRRHHALLLRGPEPDVTLADNRPELRWSDSAGIETFRLDLSRDESFLAEATRSVETDQARWRSPEPLAPGRWFWRVGAPGYDWSATWSFEQTAPADRDTTGPLVESLPTRVLTADGAVTWTVAEPSGPPKLTARVGEQAVTVNLAPAGAGQWRAVLTGPWRPGLNEVALTATDAPGNTITATAFVVCKPKPARPTAIAADGAWTDAGRRVLPLGIYQVSPAAMPTVRAGGFEVVHIYEFEGSQDNQRALAYLDAADAAGLRCFIGFDRGKGTGKGMVQGNARHLMERVAALCDHPGLYCWYLFDEPEIADQYLSPRALNGYGELVRRLDPYHVVVMTTWGKRMALYRPSFDTHWTQAYTTPAGVVKQLREHRELLGPEVPITLLNHCYDRAQSERMKAGGSGDPAQFQPDPAWLRAAALAGLTQRINGLWYWWYADGVKGWLTVSGAPEAWRALTGVTAEIKALEPILTDPAPAVTGELPAGQGLAVWYRKTVAGETTVIAVNTTEETVDLTIPAPGNGMAEVLGENRRVPLKDGAITDKFERYGAHVYRY